MVVTDVSVKVVEALGMPWGGHRNLAMRDALRPTLGEVEMCAVHGTDGQLPWVQLVCAEHGQARDAGAVLKRAVGHDGEVRSFSRQDGKWVVTARLGG